MNSDIIEALKNNEKPFCKMENKTQVKLADFWKTRHIEVLDEGGDWSKISEYEYDSPALHITYRLRPDYQKEPEIEAWPVFEHQGDLRFKRNLADMSDMGFCIDMAGRNPDFTGYLYEDGFICTESRRYLDSRGTTSVLATLEELEKGKLKVLTPTHVLFRKEKKNE